MRHKSLKKSISKVPLLLTVYCAVSGGPFGLEPLVRESGAGFSLLLIALVPLIWCIPDALTTAELASAIPEEGGYVVWVHRALGPFWAYVNGWWTWLYALVDAAIYPVLFTDYLFATIGTATGHPIESPILGWACATFIIVFFSALNIRGTKLVGGLSGIFTFALVLPFLFMMVVGLLRWGHAPSHAMPFLPAGKPLTHALADGLSIVLWNYLGWDTLTTIAEEVEDPGTAYPFSIFWGVPLVTAVYFGSVWVGLHFFPQAADWHTGVWPHVALLAGGPFVLILVTVAAFVSPVAQFGASLLGASRLPFVLAEGGFFPRPLVQIHPRFGTPARSIGLCSVILVALAVKSFQELVSLNVVLYAAALSLECISLVMLRRKEPELARPYKIPGGIGVVVVVATIPILVVGLLTYLSVAEDGWMKQVPTGIALVSGPLIYFAVSRFRKLI